MSLKMSELIPAPNPQDPNDALYQFIDTQPPSAYPNNPDSSFSHYTNRQFTPENITNSLPIVVTKTAHGLQNNQGIRATQFITIPFANATGMEQLNNKLFYIQGVTEDTFYLADRNTLPIDGRNFTPYIQGGQFTLVGQDLPIVNPSNFPPSGLPLS
jgi:hypothetical protein